MALTVSVLGGTAVLSVAPEAAQAAPGNPGTPSAGTVVYAEDFQNVPDATTLQGLQDYTGTTGQKYTADQPWLVNCNGLIASELQSPTNAAGVAACGNASDGRNAQLNWNRTQQLSYALGLHTGATPAQAQGNYADSAYTSGTPGGPFTEFQTASNIPFTASNRFITFSVDVAAINCATAAHPLLQFQLLDDAGSASDVGSQIDGCSSTKTVDSPAFGVAAARTANVGTYTSNGAQLFSGSSIGVRMINNQPSGAGNDHAIDNIRILDVTPQLDKSFSPALVRTGDTSTLTFTVTNTSELAAKNGWSFTDNLPSGLTVAPGATGGTCDATTTATGSSIAITNGNLDTGEASCTITVPVTSTTAGTYNNCPITNVTDLAGLNAPACASITFADPSFTTEKTVDSTKAAPGQKVTWTITVHNTSQVDYTTARPATWSDDLTNVLDDATYNNDASGGATYDAPTLSWSGALAAGATKTFTYSATVNTPDTGDKSLDNAVVPTNGGVCDPADSCTTTTPVEGYDVTKTVDRTSVVEGQKVTWTITVENTGQYAYTDADPATWSDDLTNVLDDATYNNDATGGATYDAPTLSWSGSLAVGATKTFTYSATVNTPDTGDKHLDNTVVTPSGIGNCPEGSTDPACTTSVPTASFSVVKTASTTAAKPGDTVTYKVVVTNTGQSDFTDDAPASFTDDMSKVIDDATYNNDATNGATYKAPTLSWSGPLAIGATKTITYSVKVNTPDTGDQILTNGAIPGIGGSCRPASDCVTNTPIAGFSIGKTASPTGEVNEGDKVTYTVTVTNTGKVAYTNASPASFTDDLSKVLDDAKITSGPNHGATLSGSTISWEGALGIGDTVKVVYVATVNTPDNGDRNLVNAVTTPDPSGSCDPDGTCVTRTPVTPATPIVPPAGPSVATGGTVITGMPAWPWIGTGALALAGMVTLGLMILRRRRHGDGDEQELV